jgi:RsiW-degrading membrane proteinase PrsW (M82 family)
MAKNWSRRYAVFAVAVIPLLMPLGTAAEQNETEEQRVVRTLDEDHATDAQREAVADAFERSGGQVTAAVLEALPRHRLSGAILPKDTWAHWGFAAASAALYFALLLLLFPRGTTRPQDLLLAGLFTATIGIVLLLLVQAVAGSGIWIRGGGNAAIISIILQFIGFSYQAALDPRNGFVSSFLGFTAGVGFCEELTKLLPLMWHFRNRATLDWRGACLWGLASGIGFGVSEGITYIVRFVACVALHAIWAASAGIMLYRRQQTIQGQMGVLEIMPPLLAILIAPMILHGAYDTLLKKDHELLAFGVAVASFGWFAYQVETMIREDRGA